MTSSLPVRLVLLTLLLCCGSRAAVAETDYLRDVKPLLAEKCYACHGALRQQSGLRVDTAAALIRGGDAGAAVTPRRAGDSLLIDVLTGDAGFRMPPANEGAPLAQQQIDMLRDWINAGAAAPANELPQEDPQAWWSYQPITRPSVPPLDDVAWCRNPVDRFVAARRQSHGLPHAAEAPAEVWLRRVFLDLIGLPPTRDELRRLLADDSPLARERIVDDLLSRPQYGERWGRHWMDVWRYSDWYGSRGINEIRYSQRHIWRWRDWIVASLNQDKGYGQMVREMLAADELTADPEVLAATGYLARNWYKFDRNVWMFETVERTGEAFLGLTLRCCRCHDHKFDPLTHEEYYRFRAFFEPHDVRTDPLSALTGTQKDATLGQVLADGLALAYDKNSEAPTYRFERGDSRYPDESKPLDPGVPAALGGVIDVQPVELPAAVWFPMLRPGVRDTLLDKAANDCQAAEGRLQAALSQAKTAARELAAAEQRPEQEQKRPRIFLDENFQSPRPDVWEVVNGSWKYDGGRLKQTTVTSFATMVARSPLVGDFRIQLRYRPLQPGAYRSIGFSFDYLDKGNSQDVYTSTGDRRQSVQAFHRRDGRQVYPQAGIVATSLKVGEETTLDVSVTGSKLTIDLNGKRRLDYVMPEKRRDGKFALWVHQGAAEFLQLRITHPALSRETLARSKRDAEQAVAVAQAKLALARGEVESLRKRLAADMARYLDRNAEQAQPLVTEARQAELDVEVLRAAVAVVVAAADESADQLAKARTNWQAAREAAADPTGEYSPVGRQYPRTSSGRRAALAKWITSDRNPRTARVAANHIWARHFGRPLVATPENLGHNGRTPTHPQLLDWLASELIEGGWKMKRIHKLLVLSSTYRMESTLRGADRTAASADPANRLLWRMNARRMEAEVVRDSGLALSARLDLNMGGPELPESDGEKSPRRSLYFRNTPNEKMPLLETFDMANPNGCYRRKESVVPQQSLAMMNSGLTQDAARRIAAQLRDESDFVTAAFETVLCRRPTPAESRRCRMFLERHAALLNSGADKAFAAGGNATRPPATETAIRAEENLVLVLLLHNDFVTIR